MLWDSFECRLSRGLRSRSHLTTGGELVTDRHFVGGADGYFLEEERSYEGQNHNESDSQEDLSDAVSESVFYFGDKFIEALHHLALNRLRDLGEAAVNLALDVFGEESLQGVDVEVLKIEIGAELRGSLNEFVT